MYKCINRDEITGNCLKWKLNSAARHSTVAEIWGWSLNVNDFKSVDKLMSQLAVCQSNYCFFSHITVYRVTRMTAQKAVS